MWTMEQITQEVTEKSATLDQLLSKDIPPSREALFKSLVSTTCACSNQPTNVMDCRNRLWPLGSCVIAFLYPQRDAIQTAPSQNQAIGKHTRTSISTSIQYFNFPYTVALPGPPPTVSSYATPPGQSPTFSVDPSLLASIRDEKDRYHRMYEAKKNECQALLKQVSSQGRD